MIPNEPVYDPDQINASILFFESLSHPSQIFDMDPITFAHPCIIQSTSQSSQQTKVIILPSITQKTFIKNFEIFVLDLCAPSSKYFTLVEFTHINEKTEKDYIVAVTKQLATQSIIIRGEYKDLTIIIYGEILDEKESASILEFYDKCIQSYDFSSKLSLIKPFKEAITVETNEMRFSNVSVTRKKSFQVID